MKKYFSKLKYIKLSEILGVFIFIGMVVPALIFKVINKAKKRKLWLVSELKDTCRDNGYHFFKYMREKHPEEYTFYVIDKKSKDYEKISKYGNIISYGGLWFWLYYMAADINIGTNKAFDPDHPLFYFLHKYLNLYNNCVFLQHGITKDDAPMFYYKNAKFKLFICGAKPEYEFIKKNFGYPEENIAYTGFARFDNLHENIIKSKQILIMPTWRNWLGREVNFLSSIEDFNNTEYYKQWNGLLNNKDFVEYIEQEDLNVKFYPHYQMSNYVDKFSVSSENIQILNNSDEDIQSLLKKSAILITDYSSVYMDFAYMRKPIIYFQFDREEYRSKQLQQGYFDYDRDGFGDVVNSVNDVIDKIKGFKCDYTVEKKYLKRMEDFFELRDRNNCERIYKAIKDMK